LVKDSKRFADSRGWGDAVFDYDSESETFKPGTTASTPPQGNDAKCGFTCHTLAKNQTPQEFHLLMGVLGGQAGILRQPVIS
jgi:hypothetical protein